MSRTLSNIDTGVGVWLKEYNDWIEYILLYKDLQGAVLLRKDVAEQRRMNNINTTTYDGCEMDVYLSDAETGFLSRFDASTLNAITSRSISTFNNGDTECTYINRRCYLLSNGNMFLETPTALEPEPNYVHALLKYYNTFTANTSRIGRLNSNAVFWFLRSPYSAAAYFSVGTSGTQYGNGAAGSSGVRPALNVSLDTIVSDEGADKICLLPTQGYREVEFSGLVLSTPTAIKKAVVNYNATNLYGVSVQITNNYEDANPVWVDATSQQEITFTNTTKTTDEWKIGVRCYGKSNGYGYFDQPIVMMEAGV